MSTYQRVRIELIADQDTLGVVKGRSELSDVDMWTEAANNHFRHHDYAFIRLNCLLYSSQINFADYFGDVLMHSGSE